VISRADLGFALSGRGDKERTLLGLAMAGGYHNSVLALAVFSGIPSAIAFTLALVVGAWRFYRIGRGTWVSDTRMLQAATLGFFFPCVGQMLMNGMGSSFYVVCVLLGAMRGFCVRDERMRREARAAGNGPLGTKPVPTANGLLQNGPNVSCMPGSAQ
jgi:hypothetical protein